MKILENLCMSRYNIVIDQGSIFARQTLCCCCVWCSVPAASNLFDMRRLEHIIKMP